MSLASCSAKHKELGRCRQQRAEGRVYCPVHHRMDIDPNYRVAVFYHEKIILGLTTPTDVYMTATEVDALFRGRARNDGRRLDHYTR